MLKAAEELQKHLRAQDEAIAGIPAENRCVRALLRRRRAFFWRKFASGLKDHAASHLDGMIGEALVEPAQQRHVHSGCNAVVPIALHQHRKHVTVQLVHRLVLLTDARGPFRVA